MNGEDEAVCEGSTLLCHKGGAGIKTTVHRPPPPGVLHFDGHSNLQIQGMSRQLVKLNKVRTVS